MKVDEYLPYPKVNEEALWLSILAERTAQISRGNGMGTEDRAKKLRRYIMVWVNYFKIADMKTAPVCV